MIKNKFIRLTAVTAVLAAATAVTAQEYQVKVSEAQEPMDRGQYEPTWESLRQYETPEWFRDAKFGIWAHWGPQCVEGSGDWMAREMYMEGTGKYNHHLKHYGHPSEFGFKDVLPLFKAEKWEPEKLVQFYKEIGAEYFFVLGNHHDNFDLWDGRGVTSSPDGRPQRRRPGCPSAYRSTPTTHGCGMNRRGAST